MNNIAIVSMIKDECDIIEIFIKHNCHYCSKFFILDHFSSDTTIKILKTLKKTLSVEIDIIHLPDPAYYQSKYITTFVRKIAKDTSFDYIIPLDADEFLSFEVPEKFTTYLKKHIHLNNFGFMPWKTYVPISDNFFDMNIPFQNKFSARCFEPKKYNKIVLGRKFAKKCTVAMGSHRALKPFTFRKPVILNTFLQHIPIRSSQQLLKKVLNGLYSSLLKKDRKANESFHWSLMYSKLKKNDFNFSFSDLQEMALKYASRDHDPLPKIDYKAPPFLMNNIMLTETQIDDLNCSIEKLKTLLQDPAFVQSVESF